MHFAAIICAFIALIPTSSSDETGPEPLVIPASEYFEGNDGPWSTFDVRVGTPEQYLRVLVSTASPQTFVVLSEYGCSEDVFSEVPSDCAVSRGNLFNPNDSSTWDAVGTYGINQNGVGLGANLGYEQIAEFGLEDLAVGLTGPGLENQTIAGIATAEPFYLGMFGLNSQPVNFTTLGNQSSPSFLTTLKDDKKTPSLSWSYTAGARYRLKRVNGQLIFSGYDTSRFSENSVSFTMADDLTRDLVVSLQSITYSGSSSSTLLSEPIDIYIDSTDPNIWLPEDVCDAFEEAFGLTLDEETNLYLINDTYHEELLDSNAEVSFRLSDVESGGDTVSIKLPYSAFGLTAEYPLVEESSHYFPLKRANSSAQYTLGRVFLQEAYLSADYERKVFNVSACVWDEGAEENIVTISSKDDESGGGSSSTSGHSTLNGGQIAGIVVGSVVGAILIVALITVLILRNRRKWLRQGFRIAAPKQEPDDSVLNGPAVFSSETRSSAQDGSMPMSAADVSAPRSTTAEGSSSRASSALPSAITGNSNDTPELDGKGIHTLNPDTGLGDNSLGVQRQKTKVASRHVHELPGSDVKGLTARERNQALRDSAVPPEIDEEEGGDSPPSPLVSTLDTVGQVGQADTDHIVSPNSPSRPVW